MTLLVDANVAIKWVIDEEGSDAARDLILSDALAAPELLFAECANALRTKVRQGYLSAPLARAAMAQIEASPIRTVPIKPHASAALEIALDLASSAYDALYLAVALAERATLVTADARLARAAAGHPLYGGAIMLLQA